MTGAAPACVHPARPHSPPFPPTPEGPAPPQRTCTRRRSPHRMELISDGRSDEGQRLTMDTDYADWPGSAGEKRPAQPVRQLRTGVDATIWTPIGVAPPCTIAACCRVPQRDPLGHLSPLADMLKSRDPLRAIEPGHERGVRCSPIRLLEAYAPSTVTRLPRAPSTGNALRDVPDGGLALYNYPGTRAHALARG